jgi:hypothetical protein
VPFRCPSHLILLIFNEVCNYESLSLTDITGNGQSSAPLRIKFETVSTETGNSLSISLKIQGKLFTIMGAGLTVRVVRATSLYKARLGSQRLGNV